jgi:hypothetical protein
MQVLQETQGKQFRLGWIRILDFRVSPEDSEDNLSFTISLLTM